MKLVSGLTTKVQAFSGHRGQSGVLPVLWQWQLEFTVVFMSCGLLGAIFGVLHHNHDQEVAGWSLSGMSLNTLIALLSALLRAQILTIAEEAISQHKWIWQLTPRPISHLSFINEASRGLWGSIILPTQLRAWFSYIYVGCLIMVLSLSIGPFTQQASSTQPCIKNITGASATIPYSWADFQTFDNKLNGLSLWTVDIGFSEAIVRASTNSSSRSSASLLQGCTTGNCSFPAIRVDIALSTMGICSRCIDTTSYVRSDNDTGVELPKEAGSLSVGYVTNTIESKGSKDLEWARANFDGDLRDVFGASIINYTFLGLTSDGCQYKNRTTRVRNCVRPPAIKEWSIPRFNVYSAACTFYFCMRHHKVDVKSGVLTETLITDSPGFFQHIDTRLTKSVSNESVQVELRGPGTETVDIPWSANCTAHTSELGRLVMDVALKMIEGNCEYPFLPHSPPSLSQRVDLLECQPWNLYGLFNDGLASFSTTSETMSRIASAISDRMREIAAKRDFRAAYTSGPEPDPEGGYIKGHVHYTTICTRFQWRWLLGPALLLLMTIGFFIHAVTRSVIRRGREPLWKSSILPVLYFNPESRGQGSKHELSELEKRAKSMIAALSLTSEGKWELVDGLDEVNRNGRSGQNNEDEVALIDLPPPGAQEGDNVSR
ncbi:unnamed protein product [Clonostachys solani]|uniref:Uncharacterized protein n=1 Tax=Clonostachys solani TaxID=160281 RepID=A0A9P0EKM2_9HYPO|nr:unnamed protein product [Clonostachys solani]